MSNRESRLLKWTGHEFLQFLNIFRKYEELWNSNNENFNKKCVRQISLRKLLVEMTELGFDIPSEIHLRKKIKNIKDVYRAELKKVKKSMIDGSEHLYKPKLLWYNEADSFLNRVTSIRTSNLSMLDPFALNDNTACTKNDVTTAKMTIKDEVVYNELIDSENTEYITDDIPQVATDAYHNLDEVSETVSSITMKCEPLIERNSSSQPPTKKINKELDYLETLSQSVSKLHEFAMIRSSEVVKDEYYYFAMHIASQLRKLPTRNFIILQERIQSLVSEERLKVLVPPDQCASTAPGCPTPCT